MMISSIGNLHLPGRRGDRVLRGLLLPTALFCAAAAMAQTPSSFAPLASSSTADLPEAPSALLASAAPAPPIAAAEPILNGPQMTPQTATKAGPVAPRYSKYISAGFTAQPLTPHDKFILGVRDLYSPFTFLGEIASAGYSHLTNGQPNYGVDRGAFGQRLGAAALRDVSEGLLSDAILAPAFHEDPRYYVEGPRYNFFHRTAYSITRPIFTRTDGGRQTVNASVLVGYAGASALSYTYYPEINRNAKDTVATFGGALAGAAIGDFVSEFSDDVLQALHLQKKR